MHLEQRSNEMKLPDNSYKKNLLKCFVISDEFLDWSFGLVCYTSCQFFVKNTSSFQSYPSLTDKNDGSGERKALLDTMTLIPRLASATKHLVTFVIRENFSYKHQ